LKNNKKPPSGTKVQAVVAKPAEITNKRIKKTKAKTLPQGTTSTYSSQDSNQMPALLKSAVVAQKVKPAADEVKDAGDKEVQKAAPV
jgi:hypothetical protein